MSSQSLLQGQRRRDFLSSTRAASLNRTTTLNPSARPAFRFLRVTRVWFSCLTDEAEAPKVRENQTQLSVTHVAMSHGPTIAWKASPTRTPPPICTSAPFPKPRWSKDRGRREPFEKLHNANFLAIGLITGIGDSSGVLHRCSCSPGKQVFESPRGIPSVANLAALAKNLHKKFTPAW